MNKLLKLNCEIPNGDNECNRYEDFISLKNKINLIIDALIDDKEVKCDGRNTKRK
jgi:hypothetical protein